MMVIGAGLHFRKGWKALNPRSPAGQPALQNHEGPAPGVLADRLAAKFLDHPPGWRLPRRSELARRYQATPGQVDRAIAELAGRGIVRETADGSFYRASPAEFLVTLDALPSLGSRVDPMGSSLARVGQITLHRGAPEEITRVLRVPSRSGACAIRSTWALDGTISAVSTTYLPATLATTAAPVMSPAALHLEVQPPPRWAAGLLRLHLADPAIILTARFDDPAGIPLALTVAVLDAARFRISVATGQDEQAAGPRHHRAADAGGSAGHRRLDVNGVVLDRDGYRAFADGAEIALARKEYDLLWVLVENAGRVLTRRSLLDVVWQPGYVDHTRTLEVHIRRLRRKLDPDSGASRIRTVRGVGYVFDTLPVPGHRM